jgi:hypothetical protein
VLDSLQGALEQSTSEAAEQVRNYKLFSNIDSSYIVPIMAGLMEGRTWFFTQAITLFICILLYRRNASMLIVITAYSDSVKHRESAYFNL